VPGTQRRQRAYLPGRQLCGPWPRQPPKPPSKRLIIGTTAIIGTTVIIGIATIIGTAAIITGITIGGRITIATIITIGIRIIGNSRRRRSNIHKYSERKAATISPAFLSISHVGIDLKLHPY
jgi:hypothetical protein